MAQGSNAVFACLTRHVEGRALRGVGPPSGVVPTSSGDATIAMVSTLLSGVVAEAPWPPDVRLHLLQFAVQISFLEFISSDLSSIWRLRYGGFLLAGVPRECAR